MRIIAAMVALLFLAGCAVSDGAPPRDGADASHPKEIGDTLHETGLGQSNVKTLSDLRMRTDPDTWDRDQAVCEGWVYQESSIANDLKAMGEITQEGWGRMCYQFSCSYEVDLEIDGARFDATINAGGWIRLIEQETLRARYFGYSEAQGKFLASCDCCE